MCFGAFTFWEVLKTQEAMLYLLSQSREVGGIRFCDFLESSVKQIFRQEKQTSQHPIAAVLENGSEANRIVRVFKPYGAKCNSSRIKTDSKIVVQKQSDLIENGVGRPESCSKVLSIVSQCLTFTAI